MRLAHSSVKEVTSAKCWFHVRTLLSLTFRRGQLMVFKRYVLTLQTDGFEQKKCFEDRVLGVDAMFVSDRGQDMRRRRAEASRARARKLVQTKCYNGDTIALTISGSSVVTGGSAMPGSGNIVQKSQLAQGPRKFGQKELNS